MVLVSELEKPRAKEEYQEHRTVYTFEGKKHPLLVRHSIQSLCNNILELNKKANLVTILLSGKSSSGKSTLTQTICHRISCKNPEGQKYIIKWFNRDDLNRLDQIINGLQKGLQYILIMDDVSFVMDQASSKQRKLLANKLTTIRHDLGPGSKVILFLNIHYGRAILPIFRDSYFRILTSVSSEDAKNWKESFGWEHQYLIDRFQKQFSAQMQHGYFYVNFDEGSYKYETDKPFRISLCSDLNGVHALLYPKEGCPVCSPSAASIKEKRTAREIWDRFTQTYTNRAKTALQYYLYFVKGKKQALPPDKQRAVNFLTNLLEKYDIDLDQLAQVSEEEKPYKKRTSNTRKKHKKIFAEILDQPKNNIENFMKNM